MMKQWDDLEEYLSTYYHIFFLVFFPVVPLVEQQNNAPLYVFVEINPCFVKKSYKLRDRIKSNPDSFRMS